MKIDKLESIRGFVAIYVVIHHFILFTPLHSVTPEIIKFLFKFGRESVLIFFLLSGFVINISFKKEKETFLTYFEKRFLRIYPILLFSFILSIIVVLLNGENLTIQDFYSLIGNIFQIQHLDNPGEFSTVFLGNLPLWSLSYEWWFYLAFYPIYSLLIINKKETKVSSIYYVLLLSLISWPLFLLSSNHLLLIGSTYLLWWVGFFCAEIYKKNRNFEINRLKHVLISIAIMASFILLPIAYEVIANHKSKAELNSVFPVTNYLMNYIEAFLIIILGFTWWKLKLWGFSTLLGYFSKLAPISYAIYIVHFPIILLNIPFISNLPLLIFIKILIILSISYYLELIFQPTIVKLYRNKIIAKRKSGNLIR